MTPKISNRLAQIPELNMDAMLQARERLDDLTKPIGSLGRLEELITRLASMTGQVIPSFHKPQAIIFAADHGVSELGVSAYGSEVTEEMVVNMCMGSAVSSVLARAQNIELSVVDVGVRSRVRHPGVIVRKVGEGTRNLVKEPAMTLQQAYESVEVGIQIVDSFINAGADLMVIGEMGIGNTTSSTAMLASLLEMPVETLVGHGTGIAAETKRMKAELIESALGLHTPNPKDPWDVLAKVGGFEIGAMAGAFIACAAARIPVLLDGVIATAAALLASRLNSNVTDFLVACHRSSEPAHGIALDALNLSPLVDWGMGLGEGSGALTILPVIRNACKVMAETATFEDARVSNPHKTRGHSLASNPDTESNRTDDGGTRHSLPEAGQAASMVQAPEVSAHPDSPVSKDFDDAERAAVYKAIVARRDIRSFLPHPIAEDALHRILLAAHHGPSVGYMQPWNFILIRDRDVLTQIQTVVERERVRASKNYPDLKRDYYLRLKVEGLLQAPLTICVTNDPTRGGPNVLGRNTIPETDLMSTSCAIENMWLAARAEGIAMGWVSIYEKDDIRRILNIPDHVDPVALLSVGYTSHFPEIPLLERVGWGSRLELDSLIFQDFWGNQEDEKR